jgi:hypothetical protein
MAAPIGLPLQPPQPSLGILIHSRCHCEEGAFPDEAIPNFVEDCFVQRPPPQ